MCCKQTALELRHQRRSERGRWSPSRCLASCNASLLVLNAENLITAFTLLGLCGEFFFVCRILCNDYRSNIRKPIKMLRACAKLNMKVVLTLAFVSRPNLPNYYSYYWLTELLMMIIYYECYISVIFWQKWHFQNVDSAFKQDVLLQNSRNLTVISEIKSYCKTLNILL